MRLCECSITGDAQEVPCSPLIHCSIRIKAPHNLESLRLPPLPRGHVYGLPAGSLTRAGTLSAPPPYSVQRPREPSSHSSSVAGQPEANFHAHMYRDPARGFRVISTAEASGGAGGAARPTRPRLGPQKNSSAAGPVPGSYRPPAVAVAPPPHKRRNSRSQPSSPALEQAPNSASAARVADGARTPGSGTNGVFGAQQTAPPPHKRHVSSGSGESLTRNGGGGGPSTPISLNGGGAAMPLTALVIGPGVQGRYGAALAEPAGGAGAEYGNAAAFAAFTAAGGEMNRPKPKKKNSSRLPSRSGEGEREGKAKAAADAAERRAATNGDAAGASHPPSAFPAGASKERPKQNRRMSSSSRVELPTPPILPPIRNLAPFAPAPVVEKLAPMPSASTAPTVRADGTTYVTSTPEDQLAADAALALSLASGEYAEASSSRSPSIATSKAQSTAAAAAVASAVLPGSTLLASPAATPTDEAVPPAPKPSKADKRYAAIQAELARERARQAEAERVRALEAHNREARKAEEARKRAEEERDKKIKAQWEMWEEVRRREKKAGLPPPAVVSLLDDAQPGKKAEGI